jgi:hypothetical protein
LLVLILWWLIVLLPYLPGIAPYSRNSASMPYVAIAVIFAILIARRFSYRMKHFWGDLCISMLIILMIVSNHLVLVRAVGNGRQDIEFKILADWYRDNADPNEKLVTTFAGTLGIYMPEYRDNFFHTGDLKGDSLEEFTQNCYDKEITYIAWDSRVGFNDPNQYMYKLWKMASIAPLVRPNDLGPYKYIGRIQLNKRKFINIFRLVSSLPDTDVKTLQ